MPAQVEVYFNLHKRCFSVRCGGRVTSHRDELVIRDARFAVQRAGQRKVRESGVKNVHAFVRGEDFGVHRTFTPEGEAYRVRYNPYVHDSFVILDGKKEVAVKASMFVLCEVSDTRTPVLWAWGVS